MSTFSIDRRISLCAFTFADGRRCRMPRSAGHPDLCTYHARKDAEVRATQQFGQNVAHDLSGKFTSALDLTSALRHLFSAVAQGHVKPKTANTLGYIAQTMVQSIHLAQIEFTKTFGERAWQETIAANLYPERKNSEPPPTKDQ
jgi:hypothetical protein